MGQVIVIPGHKDLESNIHSSVILYFDKGQSTFIITGIITYGHVLLWNGYPKTGSCHYIFCILRCKRGGMVPGTIGKFNDFHRFKCGQVDPCYPGSVVSINENPTPIRNTIGL